MGALAFRAAFDAVDLLVFHALLRLLLRTEGKSQLIITLFQPFPWLDIRPVQNFPAVVVGNIDCDHFFAMSIGITMEYVQAGRKTLRFQLPDEVLKRSRVQKRLR